MAKQTYKAKTVWRILWNEYASNTYLNGSVIKIHSADDYEFENDLMPPGAVIKQWFSKTHYNTMRIEPALPLIDGEGMYYLNLSASSEDNNDGLLVRIIYYDRYDNEIRDFIIRGGKSAFRCPLNTYSYEIQLINAGTKHFHFHYITIAELEYEKKHDKEDY